jgi:hypothetical protein
MRPAFAPLAATALVLATGCPSDDKERTTLWLALDGVETEVRLVASEPSPF